MSAGAAMPMADGGREPDFPLYGQGDSGSGTVVFRST